MSDLDKYELDDQVSANLQASGITSLFPVQSKLIPYLLANNKYDCIFPQDICVSAATGSGKTLSYVIPIVQVLARTRKLSATTRLKALILLPSRELANQVHQVFIKMIKGTGLRVALSTGQNSFEQDERSLVGTLVDPHAITLFSNDHLFQHEAGPNGRSLVDILVCTPGRLQDHVQYSVGFTLKHLRFLVLDEADRLLGNAYHSWVRTIVKSTHSGGVSVEDAKSVDGDLFDILFQKQRPLQRLLFSATLTDNPRTLALLNIFNPLVLKIGQDEEVPHPTDPSSHETSPLDGTVSLPPTSTSYEYSLPSTLTEFVCLSDTAKRPIILTAILFNVLGLMPSCRYDFNLKDDNDSMCIIFVASVESTHRLARLLQLINKEHESYTDVKQLLFRGKVAEMSRAIKNDKRQRVMEEALTGKVKILVASDSLSRGIDLTNVSLVINYDPPKQAKTYVHRCGRTARANRYGWAVTMLKKGQLGEFRRMHGSVASQMDPDDRATRLNIKSVEEDFVASAYSSALKLLSVVFSAEDGGRLEKDGDLDQLSI
jgi:ATP-dependent RNA helicase DDX51/DBP6